MYFLQSKITSSDNGYKSTVKQYQAENCKGCSLREQCHKAKGNRIINVNQKLKGYKNKARVLLTSEQGLKHRSKQPVEPEAVFGQMKFNKAYKRFRHKGFEKIYMDFGVFAIAFNLLKMWRKRLKQVNLNKIACFYLKRYVVNLIAYKIEDKYKRVA